MLKGVCVWPQGIPEMVQISTIKPSRLQLRKDVVDIESLAQSIKQKGLLQPLIVRPIVDGFEVVAGHRRLQACQMLGHREIACIIKELDDKQAYEVSIVENIQHRSLDVIEEAECFKRYVVDYGWGSVADLARRVGKSEAYVSHRIKLLGLPEETLRQVRSSVLKASHAKEIVWLEDTDLQGKLARFIIEHHLSVRQVRRIIELVHTGMSPEEALDETMMKRGSVKKKGDSFYLDRAILYFRVAMMRVDGLLEDVKGRPMEPFLRGKRFALHQMIDECIKLKMTEISSVADQNVCLVSN